MRQKRLVDVKEKESQLKKPKRQNPVIYQRECERNKKSNTK